MKPKRTQKIKWSPELAYAVGLISADGCLSIDRRHINFTSKDIKLLKTFKKCLGLRNKIGRKSSGKSSEKKYYQVQFGDVIFYRWLNEIGLTPHKSKTIGKLKIPNKYFFDFLRGNFDGDGYFYSYWDKRWKSSFMFYTIFSSASRTFIEWLRKRIKTSLEIKGYIVQNRKENFWQLKYAKRESRKLLSKLYYSNKIPLLERKYLKIKRAEVEELEDSHP
ncbi:MAG: hypothetical protein IB617_00555 [Candidatus Nealsonbacteria bacterium]|nr:MAG: hypothetical protein IB617_00555 [Candidatus Nealsonbacteria bacterium]